ncbi:MAG: helix-turn-helix domain-containing protein [Alphaproteobacteria bacterium]|nr:helix-turn-helix domain-containing protein [Alphaproteobacteria bacterium]NCQ88997.1 helix-turn-helix domain-containing protein [Alphaproteobacteria bacterium]
MSKRLYPHRLVRYWQTYDVDDICAVFSDLRLHPQTVRKWIKNGLKITDKGRPALIYGNDLITYLKENNNKNKCKTDFDQLYCPSCQDARHIFENKIHVTQDVQKLSVKGICRTCKKPMYQFYKLSDLSKLRHKFKLVGVSELYDCEHPHGKTHLETITDSTLGESTTGDLFDDKR